MTSPQPSDAEWKVLNALWRAHPASARELLAALSDEGWAYTTLKTMLTRMEEKGFVRAEMRGNAAWYEPAVTREATQRKALRSLLERAFEGATGSLLARLVDETKPGGADRKRLEAWIAEVERKEGRSDRG